MAVSFPAPHSPHGRAATLPARANTMLLYIVSIGKERQDTVVRGKQMNDLLNGVVAKRIDTHLPCCSATRVCEG